MGKLTAFQEGILVAVLLASNFSVNKRSQKETIEKHIPVEIKPNLDVPSDIDHLITLRELEEEISNLFESSGQASNLWVGLDTKVEEITETLRFQSALSSLLRGDGWQDDEFELITTGRCGSEMVLISRIN